MKPLYLSIKGFGPYLKAEIKEDDFKFLTENKLFLISGEIGAGKTTIFDAIVYALYGESTIEGRNPADLISHFIKNKPDIIPEINFKFFLDGKTYQIRRCPSFKGRVENVSLWIENKLFSAKKEEIKAKIKELIGLDAKQFKKVFLIPQGEYRKILIAKKEERESLLETIFETSLFSNWEEFLKIKIKDLKEFYQSLNKREEELKNIAQVSNFEELKNKIEELEGKQKYLENKLNSLISKKEKTEKETKVLEQILQLQEEIKELTEKFENLKSKEDEIYAKKELLKKLKFLKENLIFYENFEKLKIELKDSHHKKKNLAKNLCQIEKILESLEIEIKKFYQNEKEVEEKKQKLQNLKDLEIRFEEKEILQKKLDQTVELCQKNLKELDNLKEKINSLKKEIEKAFEEKDQLNRAIILLKEKEIISESLKAFEEYEKLIPEMKKTEKNIKELKVYYENLENIKENLEIKNRAQYLAKFLKEGEPCPVCGSTFHPHPIETENFIEELKKVEKELSEKKEKLEKEKEKFYTLQAKIEKLEESLQNKDKERLNINYKNIEKELSNLPQDYLKNLTENTNIFLEIENKIKNLKSQLNFLENMEIKKGEELEKLKNEELSISERLNIIKEPIKNYSSFEDLKFKIDYLEKEIKEWENKKEKLENNIRLLTEEKIKTQTQLINIEESIKRDLKEYKRIIKKLISLKREGLLSSINDFKTQASTLSKIEVIEEEILSFFNEVERIKKSLEDAKKDWEIHKRYWETLTQKPLEEEKLYSELEAKKNEKRLLEEALGNLNKEVGRLEKERLHLQEVLKAYEKIIKDKKSLEEEYPFLEALYNIIAGKNKKGVSFHSFVLSLFAQLILKRANFYFKEFSFGRYKFIEDEVLQKKFTLEVFDHYTGSKRETKTLSGGESFLATLSLALGTSDVILYLYRTRPFESLFIDEGFGSLDENTLEKVVNTLLSLAHHSGRIIGIISHLKELKDKFPVVLEVCKNQFSGSYIKLNKNF
jgi:exonuclease SbcC